MISAASGATAVHAASVQQEIDWIDLVLREPVMRPAVRVWNYAAPEVVLGFSGEADGAMPRETCFRRCTSGSPRAPTRRI
jgi:hypothetical protein